MRSTPALIGRGHLGECSSQPGLPLALASGARPTAAELFAQGDYLALATSGDPSDWRTYASLGLIGKTATALEGLARFEQGEATFHKAVVHWIDGDEEAAGRLLETMRSPRARKLLALIRKPRIRVLAQTDFKWFAAARRDGKFAVENIGFSRGGLPNRPYADIRQYYDLDASPDLYFCSWLEWQLIPPNIQQLPCATFGLADDYDLGIQTVHPWLSRFDVLIAQDSRGRQELAALSGRPVYTYPKVNSLPERLPPIFLGPREIDVFCSGTLFHPYHPEKARLAHQVLDLPPALNVWLFDGVLDEQTYFEMLGRAKVGGFLYHRRPGLIPRRGIEVLAMGSCLAVQEGSSLLLYVGEDNGVVTYDFEAGALPEAVLGVLSDWPRFQDQARRGALRVREEFAPSRVASQLLRFLAYLAAVRHPSRPAADFGDLDQKAVHSFSGGSPHGVHTRLCDQNLARWTERQVRSPSPRLVNDSAREIVIEQTRSMDPFVAYSVSNRPPEPNPDRFATALRLYRSGVNDFPRSLVLRFNLIRTALHFGDPTDVADALELAEQTLREDLGSWEIDPLEDVFPYSFLSPLFNYRAYLDLVTRHLQTKEPVAADLARLIHASVHGYLSFYTPDPTHAQNAMELDPEFPLYRLKYAQQLVARGAPGDVVLATNLLEELADASMFRVEAFDLLSDLHARGLYQRPDFSLWAAKMLRVSARSLSLALRTGDGRSATLQPAPALDHPVPVSARIL